LFAPCAEPVYIRHAMTLRRAALTVLVIPLVLSLAACAEAPPPVGPPMASSAPAEPRAFEPGAKAPMTEPDAEMMALSRAEDEIDKLFPAASKGRSPKKGDAKPIDKGPAKDAKEEAQGLSTADPCATACRALASMASSADHLCKLAGETDGRCEDARGRVRGATTRVKSACPSCAAGGK
jgi:hypothetical protein